MGALSKLDEALLNPEVRTCSVAAPGTSRNNNSENREPIEGRFLGNPCPKVVFSACHTSNPNASEQGETHHLVTGFQESKITTSTLSCVVVRYKYIKTSTEEWLLRDEQTNELYHPLTSPVFLKRKKEMLYSPLDFENNVTVDALVDSRAYVSAIASNELDVIKQIPE